jgi:hypothetical protein
MSSTQEFKKAIREGRLNDALAIVMGNAPELHITTAIADSAQDSFQSSKEKALQTHINLVQGKITNEIGEELIEDDMYSFIQEFHLQQLAQGHQIINQNLQSIQQIFRLLTVLQQQEKGESYTPINTWRINDTALPPASVAPSSYNNTIDNSAEITLASQSDELEPIDDDDDMVNELLSLDDIEIEQPIQTEAEESPKNEEDWGDWLNEDSSESEPDVIGLDELEIEQAEDWQSEDWGDETEFIATDEPKNQ